MSLRTSYGLESAARRARLKRMGANLVVLVLVLLALLLAKRLLPTRDHAPFLKSAVTAPEPRGRGFVKEVRDGDSLVLDDGVEVRLKGIDTPEHGRPFSREAAAALSAFVLAREVGLEYEARETSDRYGRLLAFLSTDECPCVSEALVRMGLAWIYRQRPGTERFERLLEAQRDALAAGRGLWRGLGPGEGAYVGSRSSRVLHRRECVHARKITQKKESFERLYDAFWQGYSPCRSCFRIRRPPEGF